MERKTTLTLFSFVWVGGETAKWLNAAEGETVAAFLCLFGMSDPVQRKKRFLLRVCFIDEASGEYTGREVWQKLHKGGGGGGHPPSWGVRRPNLCVMHPPHGSSCMRPRGEGPPSIRSGGLRWWSLWRMPPPPVKGKPPPPPSRRMWRRWRPNPPLSPLMWRPWGPVWPPT